MLIAGQYPSRQGNAGSDLCGVVRTHRIRATIICHHIARSENLVDSDGTQLRCLSSKNVRKLALLSLVGMGLEVVLMRFIKQQHQK